MSDDPMSSLLDADAALLPFLRAADETSESRNVATARALVVKVLAQPDIFCGYDQIKHSLQACIENAPDGDKVLRTLDLFSYGNYADYVAGPHEYLALSDAQLNKLRHLTVLSLVQAACQRKQSSISYDDVQAALNMDPGVAKDAVEDVLIHCIYSRVVRGQLCQKTRRLILLSQRGPPLRSRDVPPRRVAELLDAVHRLQESVQRSKSDVHKDRGLVLGQLERSRQESQKHRQHLNRAKDLAAGRIPQSSSTWGRGEGKGGHDAAATAAAAIATGQDPATYQGGGALSTSAGEDGDAAGSRRQKRSRGGLSGIADTSLGGRFQL